MKLKKIVALSVLVLGVARYGYAGNGGAEPFDFLFLDANARAVGLGGSYTSLANDSNALLYNPAGLGMLKRNEATFMHNVHIEGVSQDYIGLAILQGLGVNFNYVKFGDTRRTTYNQPGGATLNNFGISDLAVTAGYGHVLPMHDALSLGVAIKYIRESIDSQSVNAIAFDFGALYAVKAVPHLNLGLSVQNAGPDVRYQKVAYTGPREKLPVNVRGGASYWFSAFDLGNTVTVDLSKERSQDTVASFGIESVILKMFALRLGYNSRNSAGVGLTGGVGYVQDNYAVDYAVLPMGSLGVSHRISATVRWGAASDKGMAKSSQSLLGSPKAGK